MTVLQDLSLTQWLLLAAATFVVGFSKTSIGGAASIGVAVFAAILPAKQSTGTILPLLIVGDIVAVSIYRRHANWPLLVRLIPWVAVGLGLGVVFLALVDDDVMRTAIGLMLLALVGVQLATRRGRLQELMSRGADGTKVHVPVALTASVAVLAGFCTMTANAAGPLMTIYLLLSGMTVLELLGTGAWFYLIVNVMKIPLSASLGLMPPATLTIDLILAPTVLLGGLLGAWVIRRMNRSQFEIWALLLAAVSAALLLI